MRDLSPGVGGEIQLTDAINTEAARGQVDAICMAGRRYDCGSKLGYLEAILDYALVHENYRDQFAALLRTKLSDQIGDVLSVNSSS